MKKTCWLNLILWSLLSISGLFAGCSGSKRLSILVTRPAEINLRDFDKIAIGEIQGSGSGFVSKLDDLGKFLQGVESRDTWVRRLSSEILQALAASERFELLDYESLKSEGEGRSISETQPSSRAASWHTITTKRKSTRMLSARTKRQTRKPPVENTTGRVSHG